MHGRNSEVGELRTLLTPSRNGTGAVIIVEGGPGMGKSRLIGAAAEIARSRRMQVRVAELGTMTSTPAGDPSLALVGQGARDGFWTEPTLVAVDDLHEADARMRLEIAALARRTATQPIFLLITSAPIVTGSAQWRFTRSLPNHRRLPLGPLFDEAVAAFVGELLDARPAACIRHLTQLADGNPALVEALLEAAVETGSIQREGGLAALTEPLPADVRVAIVLDSLLGAVAAEGDPRSPRELDSMLRVAAMLGESFLPGDLAKILGQATLGLLPALDCALNAGILVARDDRFAFRNHALLAALRDTVPAPLRAAMASIGGPEEPAATADGAQHSNASELRGVVGQRARRPTTDRDDGRLGVEVGEATAGRPPSYDVLEGLTAAERGVARLVAAGLTNGGIAQQLIISKRTVESHMSSLYRKLGVENRVALARAVLSEGASQSSTCV
jgi:DNA-binding CsgD family transcriptional regulator